MTTANRTEGYCMPHAPQSLERRAGGESILLGGEVGFEEVKSEFLRQYATASDPRRSDSLEMFRWVEARVRDGDRVLRFTVDAPRPHAPVFATKGYAIVREGHVIDGVIMDTEVNPDYGSIFEGFEAYTFTEEEKEQNAREAFVSDTDEWRRPL